MLDSLVKKLEHFLTLPDHEKAWLSSLAIRTQEFPAHADIVRQDDTPIGVFVVIGGHACRYKILPDGGRQILDFMFAGDMTELHGLLLHSTDHGILALGATIIAWLDHERLLRETVNHPFVSLALWWNSLQRIAILRERIAVIGRRHAYARIAHLLCETFERLRLIGEATDPHYLLPMTQVEVADALGISEIHANRMLRRLQREQLIRADHRSIQIPDITALKTAGEFDGRYLHLDGVSASVLRQLSVAERPS
jgi:CRP-like cAMP-binding protein